MLKAKTITSLCLTSSCVSARVLHDMRLKLDLKDFTFIFHSRFTISFIEGLDKKLDQFRTNICTPFNTYFQCCKIIKLFQRSME